MSTVTTKPVKPPASRGIGVVLGLAIVLLGSPPGAGEPARTKTPKPAAAGKDSPHPAVFVPSANTIQITRYATGPAQSSQEYTEKLFNALQRRTGLVSDIDVSGADILEARRTCREKKVFCDVVGVVEKKIAEDRMVLTLTVYSVPNEHAALHKPSIEEEHRCNPSRLTEAFCRTQLIGQIVEELAGLDKDHRR